MIDSGMCIGCGACVAVDPDLELTFDERHGIWRPNGPSIPGAAALCPAIRVDFEGMQERRFPGQESTAHGVISRVALAQSTHEERNLNASSGGLIKELCMEMLRSGEADGVIALTEIEGLRYEPRLVTRVEDVDRLPGSIYHHVPFDNAIRLLRETTGRVVLVAVPCQLEGIYAYIDQVEPELGERIALTIGLLCGWIYSHHALRAIACYKRIPYDEVTGIRYRGGGPIGKLRLLLGDKEKAVSRRLDFGYQVAFDRSFNNPRCHLCINHSNFLADIVVGDAWLPSTVSTRTGISLVICRKTGTDALLQRLVEAGRTVATEVSIEEVTESQGRRVVFGDFAYAYAEYLREIGRHAPDMIGPNRPEARLAARSDAKRFDDALLIKLRLMRDRRYWRLWWRKATIEFGSIAGRYIRWFAVRILRVKSLTRQRKELSRDQLTEFR